MRQILFLLSISILLVNCGSPEKKRDNSVKFITYNALEYSLSFPSDWSNATDKNPNVDFVVVAPPDSKNDVFTDNVNIIIQDIGDTIDIQRFLELTEAQLDTYIPDHVMAEKKIVKKNGMDCLILEYQAKQNNFDLRYLQHAYIYNHKAYIVTFTAEQVIFKSYREIANQILDSFHLKK